jgi:hypothetical protein
VEEGLSGGRLAWYARFYPASHRAVLPILLLGFLASGCRPIAHSSALWAIVLAALYALLLRRGLHAQWGGWVTAGRCLLLLALGAAAWVRLVLRYGDELDLGLRGVLPEHELGIWALAAAGARRGDRPRGSRRARDPDRTRLPAGETMSAVRVPLGRIAHARSGDKGEASNAGLIADSDALYEVIRREVTAERVKQHFAGFCRGKVERFEVPRLRALNFLLHDSLGGGGTASLITDAQGKTHGQGLLAMEIEVPSELLPEPR